jgi:hypothetical protein
LKKSIITGEGSVGSVGGSVGPQINGNLHDPSSMNVQPLHGEANAGAGTGIFFFGGVHVGVRF